jgi:hypothetical protein
VFARLNSWSGKSLSRTNTRGVRLCIESLEDRLGPAPVTFTFQGVGTVPPNTFMTPDTAYMRFTVPTQVGDEVDVFVRLTSSGGPGEAGEVSFNNRLFQDAQGRPLPPQTFNILSSSLSAIGPSINAEDADYSGTPILHQIPSGNNQTFVFTGMWDGDETATINLLLKPQSARDVTSLFQVSHHAVHKHARTPGNVHARTRLDVDLTLTNNARLQTFVPAASPNPSTVPLAIHGPFYVILDGLAPRDHLLNRAGLTPDGRPFAIIYPSSSDGVLDFGQSASTKLVFHTLGPVAPVHFSTEVWAGLSPP